MISIIEFLAKKHQSSSLLSQIPALLSNPITYNGIKFDIYNRDRNGSNNKEVLQNMSNKDKENMCEYLDVVIDKFSDITKITFMQSARYGKKELPSWAIYIGDMNIKICEIEYEHGQFNIFHSIMTSDDMIVDKTNKPSTEAINYIKKQIDRIVKR